MGVKLLKANPALTVALFAIWLFPAAICAKENTVMGKLDFAPESKGAKTAGVWVDGQYVGYLHELKGSKSVMLLPGLHTVTVRENGYNDFTKEVSVQPGQARLIKVVMTKAVVGRLPPVLATVKISVQPSRAAVFVDGQYVGHVSEFEGMRRGLLVAPGGHQISVALAGYRTFKTDISPAALQTVEIKTQLVKTNGPVEAPLVQDESGSHGPSPSAALPH